MRKSTHFVRRFFLGFAPVLIVAVLTLGLMVWSLQRWSHPFDNIDPFVARDHWPDPPATEIRAGIPQRAAESSVPAESAQPGASSEVSSARTAPVPHSQARTPAKARE